MWVVRCHPKKLLLGRDEAFRCRVLSGLSQGVHAPQISGRLNTEASETVPPMGTVFQIARREAIGDAMIDTWIYAHLRWWSSRTSCDCPRARHVTVLARVNALETPVDERKPPIAGM